MIEVLFGESEAGAMKVAKNTIITGKVDGPTSVWIAGKKKPPERENCGWIEGTAEDVICLGFLLDVGNIRKDINSEYRKHLIYSMYAQEQCGKDEKMDAEVNAIMRLLLYRNGASKSIFGRWETNQGVVQRCTIFKVWVLSSVCQLTKISE